MSQEAAYGKTEQCRTGFDVIISVNFLESSKFWKSPVLGLKNYGERR